MFRQTGSPQLNAAPLQSFVKQVGFGQKTPNPVTAMKNPMVPKGGQGWTTPMAKQANKMPFLEPFFMHLIGKYMGPG